MPFTGTAAGSSQESADLLYNLSVLWAEAESGLLTVEDELKRRKKLLGIAEKAANRIQNARRKGPDERPARAAVTCAQRSA